MHEQRRFAIALASIGGCVCLAAGIVVTGLPEVTTVPVPAVPKAPAAQMLPPLPMPSLREVPPMAAATASAPGNLPLDLFGKLRADGERGRTVEKLGAPRVDRSVQSSVVNRQFTPPPLPQPALLGATPLTVASMPPMLSNAPRATGTHVVFAESRARERDPVTGAFVTAGSHVGKNFRTVGRTLKRVF
jgi:hypothetical protein